MLNFGFKVLKVSSYDMHYFSDETIMYQKKHLEDCKFCLLWKHFIRLILYKRLSTACSNNIKHIIICKYLVKCLFNNVLHSPFVCLFLLLLPTYKCTCKYGLDSCVSYIFVGLINYFYAFIKILLNILSEADDEHYLGYIIPNACLLQTNH